MGRSISANLQSILDAPTRSVEYTVDLTFPAQSALKFATAPLDISEGVYSNDVESVSEILQTLENPTDQVRCALQNKDRVLGLNIAANWQEWREAEAVIGRYYTGGAKEVWIEMFRGAVQRPDANDSQILFDVVTDTVSKGNIVANRTGAPNCGFKFTDPPTCGYSGSETDCNHNLKSKGGCDGRSNSHRFGGTESRYNPDDDIPGTGGNQGDIDPPGGCPRLDQFIAVKGLGRKIVAKMVGFLHETDWIYNPIDGEFHAINALRVLKGVPGFELGSTNGAVGYTSDSHLALWYREHATGEVVTKFVPGDPLLTFDLESCGLVPSQTRLANLAGVDFDVLRIEMASGHIYAVGNSPSMPLIVSHNSKNPLDV